MSFTLPDVLPPRHPPPGDLALQDRMRRVEARFVELNSRIARLCRLLDVRLDGEADLQRLLAAPAPVQGAGSAGAAARREAREWAELRALLKMRCDLLTETLQAFGLAATCTLAEWAEADLQRLGFAPGSDGFAMLARLQALAAAQR